MSRTEKMDESKDRLLNDLHGLVADRMGPIVVDCSIEQMRENNRTIELLVALAGQYSMDTQELRDIVATILRLAEPRADGSTQEVA